MVLDLYVSIYMYLYLYLFIYVSVRPSLQNKRKQSSGGMGNCRARCESLPSPKEKQNMSCIAAEPPEEKPRALPHTPRRSTSRGATTKVAPLLSASVARAAALL